MEANQTRANFIAIDASKLYWSTLGTGAGLFDAPLSGGTPTILASTNAINGIAVDAINIYWTVTTNPGTVMAMPLSGGPAVTLASGQNQPTYLTVDSTAVYWTNYDAVMKVTLNNGTVSTIASNVVGAAGIAVDASSVYWATAAANNCGVMRATLSGTGASLVGTYAGCGRPWGVAVDATNVYWTDNANGTVMKAPLGGGPSVTLASGLAFPEAITQDSKAIFWTDDDQSGCTAACAASNVMKIAK